MKAHHYDIVRKDVRRSTWLEDAEDLDSAKSRIRELVSFWPGEFQIVDQSSHRIVATVSGETDAEVMPDKSGVVVPGVSVNKAMKPAPG
jgi:hypothetical protein